MPQIKKDEENDNVIRQPRGDVAEYSRGRYVSPEITRSSGSRTIVPKGGEIDQELKAKTHIQDASLGDEYDNPQYMAQGGMVHGDLDLLNTLTPGTSQQIAPPPQPQATIPQLPPMAPVPQLPSPKNLAAPMAQTAPKPLPGMPASVTPSMIESYLSTQKNKLNRYGAEDQMVQQQATNDHRRSLGYNLTSGAKGLADALMMGVAGAGNPNWQGQYVNQQNLEAKENMDTLRNAEDSNRKNVEGNMSLDQMDPSSPISQSKQESYSPLFQKLGYDPGALRGMSAANIDNALSLMAAYGGKEIESMIKQYDLEIERARLAAAVGKQSSEEGIERDKMKADAATEVLKRAKNARILGIPIPGTAEVSGKEEKEAQNVLVNQMKGTSGFLKTATNPETGEKMGTRDGKNWEIIK